MYAERYHLYFGYVSFYFHLIGQMLEKSLCFQLFRWFTSFSIMFTNVCILVSVNSIVPKIHSVFGHMVVILWLFLFCILNQVFRKCILIQCFIKFKAMSGIICSYVLFYLNPIVLTFLFVFSCSDDSQRYVSFFWNVDILIYCSSICYQDSYRFRTSFKLLSVSLWLSFFVCSYFVF